MLLYGVKAAHAVNDGLAEFVGRAPDRLIGIGTVPLQDGAEAASELERSMHDLGFKDAEILTNVDGRELSDASLSRSGRRLNNSARSL
jgi:aminocarboxymuconate-semialdehyde decarboxylase